LIQIVRMAAIAAAGAGFRRGAHRARCAAPSGREAFLGS
jgi:hypothetical protein